MHTKHAIGFDYGGVIGGSKFNFTERICQAIEVSPAEYRQVYFSHNYLMNTGKISDWKEFWPIVLKELDRLNKLDQAMLITNTAAKILSEVDENILEYVSELRARGFSVGLLSNAARDFGLMLRQQKLDQLFDAFLISAEIGLQKPNPDAFKLLAKKLNCNLSDLIFIDDAEVSLSTASVCGFTPILFKSYEQMKSDLEQLLQKSS